MNSMYPAPNLQTRAACNIVMAPLMTTAAKTAHVR